MVYLYMPENPQVTAARRDPATAATKMWFWIGVSSITVIIFILWAWAAKINLTSFNWKKTPEAQLIEKSKEDWRAIFNNEESARQNRQVKSQIKEALNKIMAEANSSTPAASTTDITGSTLINSTTQTP